MDDTLLRAALDAARPFERRGRVAWAYGGAVRATGLDVRIGQACRLDDRHGAGVPAEVIGFADGSAILAPLRPLRGLGYGAEVTVEPGRAEIAVGEGLLGRVVDADLAPLDGGPPIAAGQWAQPIYADPPLPTARRPIGEVFETGVRVIDALLTVGVGQRLGIFAVAGAGKSTLLASIARHSSSDVNVIALVGERGREVVEFLEQALTAEGLARSVVVVATSDRSAMERIRAANVATAMAEGFCRQGRQVALLVDSVTRYARAVRELGLAMGEPPVRKGFTPSLFVELPRLLERSGRMREGAITAFYTVLLEEDDDLDPVGEEVRSILDGHIRLSRRLAERGRYPAVDVAGSISRLFHRLASPDHKGWSARVRSWLGKLEDTEFLRQVGEYHSGGDPEADLAIARADRLERFLGQAPEEGARWEETLGGLAALAEAPC